MTTDVEMNRVAATPAGASAPAEATAPPLRWIIALILFLAVLSAFFDRISVAVLFTNKEFQDALGTGFNPTLLGLLMTAFVFAYGVSGVLLSFVGDLFGLRRSLAIGTAFWGIFMTLMAGAGSFTQMLSMRILLGVAEGPQFSITNSLIKRWFPPREQAREVLAIVTTYNESEIIEQLLERAIANVVAGINPTKLNSRPSNGAATRSFIAIT